MRNMARQSVWNPWHELNRPFGNVLTNPLESLLGLIPEFRPQYDYPPINVWKGENLIKMSVKLPGVKLEDIDISLKHDTLTLKCSLPAEALPEGYVARRQERINGSWQRSFSLPFAVDADAIAANYKDGILSITLPKARAEMPRKISVNA